MVNTDGFLEPKDTPVILGWQCPCCEAIFATQGYCHFDGEFLRPMVEQIPEL